MAIWVTYLMIADEVIKKIPIYVAMNFLWGISHLILMWKMNEKELRSW